MSTVLKCDVCNKEFSSKSTLSTHQKSAKFCLAKKAAMASNASSDTTVDNPSNESSSVPKEEEVPYGNFIEEIKRHYEDKIRDRDERISSLESLIEKMEAKLERYQTTIVSIVLKSFGSGTYRRRQQRCSDPECQGCRTEEAIEERVSQEMDSDD
jgi:hypothetical protein